MKWVVLLCLGLGGCAAEPAGRCSLQMSGLEEMERRARWRAWMPQAQLRVESVERPGFDAVWARPRYGPEKTRRSPAWRSDVTVSAVVRWELDAQVPHAKLAAVRAGRARALGRCGERHVR